MTDRRISELDAAGSLASANIVPIVQGTSTKRTTLQAIADWVVQTASSFTQSGSGASARAVQAKLREGWVSVKDFGATGDGVTADTTAFTNAIATGKNIFVPIGTYLVGSGFTLTTAGQKFAGEGKLSVIQASAASFNIFTPQADYIEFESLRFNGAASSNATTQYAIFTATANPASYLKVRHCLFSGASSSVGLNNGVKFDGDCDYGEVSDCDFERLYGSISGTGYGVLAGDVVGLRAVRNRGIGSSGRGRHLVYLSGGASDCLVALNYCKSFNEGAYVQASSGAQNPCKRNVYAHNHADACCANGTAASGAIEIAGHSEDAKVIYNVINASGSKGITVDGTNVTDCSETEVTGNTVTKSQTMGIDLTSAVGALISGNKVRESSQASAGTYPNIRVLSDGTTAPTRIHVVGNQSTGTVNARSAFQINSTVPTVTAIKLMGNYFPTCNAASIELNGVTCEIDGWIRHSETYDPGSITNGAALNYGGISVPGAEPGDLVIASHTSNIDGVSITAQCYSNDLCQVIFLNNSGGAKDILTGTLRLAVQKRTF